MITISVTEEEEKIAEMKEVIADKQRHCDEDLARAEPAVRQAEAALDTLNKVKELAVSIYMYIVCSKKFSKKKEVRK